MLIHSCCENKNRKLNIVLYGVEMSLNSSILGGGGDSGQALRVNVLLCTQFHQQVNVLFFKAISPCLLLFRSKCNSLINQG